jgi:hypothetical protein
MKKKEFTLKMEGKTVVNMEISGDGDVVQAFSKEMFLDTFSLFHKMKDELADFFVNGIKSKYQLIARDEKGRYVNPLKKSVSLTI